MSFLPMRGLPERVMLSLYNLVRAIIETPNVSKFKFGRTNGENDIFEGMKKEEGEFIDSLSLYQSFSEGYAKRVEEHLIMSFQFEEKCIQKTLQCGQHIKGNQRVYIMFWVKKD